MRYVMRGLLGAIGLIFAAGILLADERAVLRVTGEGRVAVVPDMATLRLGVQSEAALPGLALENMTRDMTPVLEALAEAGIADRDVQTGQLNLRPIYGDQEELGGDGPRIVGYVAATSVTARVRDLTGLDALLDKVVNLGANRFGGLSFTLADPQPSEDLALTRAVRDAKRNAALMAQAAELTLGDVIEIAQSAGLSGGPVMMEARLGDTGPIAAGEVETQAQVNMVFAILP